jgi:hypothetical protein
MAASKMPSGDSAEKTTKKQPKKSELGHKARQQEKNRRRASSEGRVFGANPSRKRNKTKKTSAAGATNTKVHVNISDVPAVKPPVVRAPNAAPVVLPPKQPVTHRDWYVSDQKTRRCQHYDGKKQCKNKASKGFFTCSAHSRLELSTRAELQTPYGPTWMKRLKRNIKKWFGKDLDFWSNLPLESWAKASDVIDVALDMVPERAEELYEVLGVASEEEGLRPAARLARAMLREKFMLNPGEEGKLPEIEETLYRKWKANEFYAIFGYNGDKTTVKKDSVPTNPTVTLSDSRTRAELKLAFPSINPEGQIMFLEVSAIDAETQLHKLQRQLPRDTFGKTALDAKISDLYHMVEGIKAEIATLIVVPPFKASELAKLEFELESLIAKRKDKKSTTDEVKQAIYALRERQAQLLGGRLDRPERLYYKFTTLKEERNNPSKKTGNRGKHSSKRTSKRRIGKGTAGSGHNANVRGRFNGSSPVKEWDEIIADNGKFPISETKKTSYKKPEIQVSAVTAPIVLPPKVNVPSGTQVMIPIV